MWTVGPKHIFYLKYSQFIMFQVYSRVIVIHMYSNFFSSTGYYRILNIVLVDLIDYLSYI